MRVEFDGSDYYFNLTKGDFEQILTPTSSLGGFRYPSISSQIIGPDGKYLDAQQPHSYGIIAPSNDASVRFSEGFIKFSHTEDEHEDIQVLAFTGRLYDLAMGLAELPYLMTRYDGMNKVWIHPMSDEEDRFWKARNSGGS